MTSLVQHLIAVATDAEIYRPAACPHCRCAGMWRLALCMFAFTHWMA